MVRTAGLALLMLLAVASTASASSLSLQGTVVTYQGDAAADTVRPKLTRKGRKLIRRRTKIGMTLVVDVTDDRAQTTTLRRALRFRR